MDLLLVDIKGLCAHTFSIGPNLLWPHIYFDHILDFEGLCTHTFLIGPHVYLDHRPTLTTYLIPKSFLHTCVNDWTMAHLPWPQIYVHHRPSLEELCAHTFLTGLDHINLDHKSTLTQADLYNLCPTARTSPPTHAHKPARRRCQRRCRHSFSR